VFELISQLSCRFLEVEFLYNRALVIKINEQRLGINFEGKRLFLFGLNLNSLNFSLCRCADLNVDWRLKKGDLWILRIGVLCLLLANSQLKSLDGFVIMLRNFKHGMAHLVEPFVEEPIHRLTG